MAVGYQLTHRLLPSGRQTNSQAQCLNVQYFKLGDGSSCSRSVGPLCWVLYDPGTAKSAAHPTVQSSSIGILCSSFRDWHHPQSAIQPRGVYTIYRYWRIRPTQNTMSRVFDTKPGCNCIMHRNARCSILFGNIQGNIVKHKHPQQDTHLSLYYWTYCLYLCTRC